MIQLRIDADALATLFPKGSEMRVELQNACVAEFARKNLKPQMYGEEIKNRLDNAKSHIDANIRTTIQQFEKQYLRENGFNKSYANSYTYTPDPDIKAAIHNAIRAAVKDGMGEITKDLVDKVVRKLGGTIEQDARVVCLKIINDEVTPLIQERLKNVVSSVFK